MDAAPIQWRPLGQMLVERGLLTSDELEEVLRVQHQSGKPLGQIIVDRGLISAPTLAVTLAEQCGVELETDKGFGTGLWTAIQARHKAENRRRSDLRVVPVPDEPDSDAPPAVEQDERLDLPVEAEEPAPGAGLAEAEPRVIELEEPLPEQESGVAALEAAERTRQQELQQLAEELAETSARAVELEQTLEERERRIEELEAEPQAAGPKRDERELVDEARAAELAERERELAEREEAITGRQRAILTAAADLEQRRRSLEERERELVEVTAGRSSGPRPDEVVPPSNEVQEFAERHLPTAPERPSAADGYRWNLDTLTRLVEEGANEFPDRADEWRYTLFYLRNEARVDGALPTKFDSLVEECFGELLATSVSPGSSA